MNPHHHKVLIILLLLVSTWQNHHQHPHHCEESKIGIFVTQTDRIHYSRRLIVNADYDEADDARVRRTG